MAWESGVARAVIKSNNANIHNERSRLSRSDVCSFCTLKRDDNDSHTRLPCLPLLTKTRTCRIDPVGGISTWSHSHDTTGYRQ